MIRSYQDRNLLRIKITNHNKLHLLGGLNPILVHFNTYSYTMPNVEGVCAMLRLLLFLLLTWRSFCCLYFSKVVVLFCFSFGPMMSVQSLIFVLNHVAK
jgi:hypothetical protein